MIALALCTLLGIQDQFGPYVGIYDPFLPNDDFVEVRGNYVFDPLFFDFTRPVGFAAPVGQPFTSYQIEALRYYLQGR